MNKLKDIKLKNQLIISTYIMLFLLLILKPTLVPHLIHRVITAFKPFIIGGVIAFLLNLIMKPIEEKIIKPLSKNYKKINRFSRGIALIITLVIVAILIYIFISYIVPQLANSLKAFTNEIPGYISAFQNQVVNKFSNLDALKDTSFDIQALIQKFFIYIKNFINVFVSNVFNFTIGITNFFVNLFLGIIISMYILLSKEKLALQFKKLIYVIFKEKTCRKILYVLRLSNNKFSRFILGQSIDGLILGTTFFIVFSLVKIPFALLISIMIPILNFIPIFGTYVGIAISAFIILMIKPSLVLIFLVLILLIQQIDGKFIYPFVVGNSLGLSPLWILFAILVGGNLFGIVGMVVGMPLTSVVYELCSKTINEKIKKKNIINKIE